MDEDQELTEMLADPQHKLWKACYMGRLDIVTSILETAELKEINLPKSNGIPPLFVACLAGHGAVISLLLENKRVDVNAAIHDGITALIYASGKGHVEVVSLLLADPRIDVNQTTLGGTTAFYSACSSGHVDIFSLLLADPRVDHFRGNPLYPACRRGNEEIVSRLLAIGGFDANQPSGNGSTPLWIASHEGHLSVVKLLLANVNDIDMKKKPLGVTFSIAAMARSMANGVYSVEVAEETGVEEEEFEGRKVRYPVIADLIDEYERDAGSVRLQLMKELGLDEKGAAEVFALAVFLSDGHLKLPEY